jgi:hypothetical protein
MPSIAAFLKITIPKERQMESDGVSLTGKISATNAEAKISNGQIQIKWKVQNKGGMAKIWLSTTNNFRSGGKDDYMLMRRVPVANGQAVIDESKFPSDFYKIAIEMPFNILNRWVMEK